MDSLESFLRKHNLDLPTFYHSEAITCADYRKLNLNLPGAHTKNLFLRDKQGTQHFLLVVPADLQINLSALSLHLSVNKLGMASVDILQHFLKVAPGSVSILALFADLDNKVQLLIDQSLWNTCAIQAHPMVNNQTMIISQANLLKFLKITGHEALVLPIPSMAHDASDLALI
jgi:Ala-tRNA(Pro) deacylase